jgi:SAM-dependent methyltransferase
MGKEQRDPSGFYDEDYFEGRSRGVPPHSRESIYPVMRRTTGFLQQRLHAQRALDVGCAKGYLVEALNDEGMQAYGTDISLYAVGKAEAAVAQRLCVSDAAKGLPYRDDSFDLVVSLDLMEHLPEPLPVLCEMRRVLEPAGHLYLKICHPRHPNATLDPTHVNVQPLAYWLDMFRRAGLKPVRIYESDLTDRRGLKGWLAGLYWRLRERFELGARSPDFKFLLTKTKPQPGEKSA